MVVAIANSLWLPFFQAFSDLVKSDVLDDSEACRTEDGGKITDRNGYEPILTEQVHIIQVIRVLRALCLSV